MLNVIALAVAAFVATNIDNLFVLLAFVAGARGRWRHVAVGQYVGSVALIAVSVLLAASLTRLPDGYAGLLGALPIGVGLSQLCARLRTTRKDAEDPKDTPRIPAKPDTTVKTQPGTDPAAPDIPEPRRSSWWTVAWVALANGSDNLAVYVPLYAGHSHAAWAWITGVFVAMTGVWCVGAIWLVAHPLLGAPLRRYGAALLPPILIAIGVSVIAHNDTLRIVFGL